MAKVSIIIPYYNNPDFIEETVESAVNQTYDDKEIILIDDGSDHNSKEVLKNLSEKVDLIITQQNAGPSAARNVGIKKATGEYILVLDSDDYFESTFCEEAVNVFKEKEGIKMVTCHARWFWNDEDYQIFKPKGGDIQDFMLESAALGNSLFLKKDWELVEGYDEKMTKGWEDWEFFIRLHKYGGYTYVIPKVLFHYRKLPCSRTTIANKNKYELWEYIFLKHSNLYKEHFPQLIKYLLLKIKKEEQEKIKNTQRIEFRVGKSFLEPFRLLKAKLFN